jgi:hypothetical protein
MIITVDLHSKISAFLRDRAQEPYCYDCIAEVTANDLAQVRHETASMRGNEPQFVSGGNICTRCGGSKAVTTQGNARAIGGSNESGWGSWPSRHQSACLRSAS